MRLHLFRQFKVLNHTLELGSVSVLKATKQVNGKD